MKTSNLKQFHWELYMLEHSVRGRQGKDVRLKKQVGREHTREPDRPNKGIQTFSYQLESTKAGCQAGQ